MTHTYAIKGMTCNNCVATVTRLLTQVPGVKEVKVTLDPPRAGVTMDRHIDIATFKKALSTHPNYQIDEYEARMDSPALKVIDEEPQQSFFEKYKPILLVFAFILGVTVLIQVNGGSWNTMEWMRHFMAGFFIVFSFFKLLDLPGFASNYFSYDIVAKRWYGYGYVYPFIELLLGILFLLDVFPVFTNVLTILVMGVSSIGVFQSLMAKRKIKCACLGAVFNVPMSTITLIEDTLMVIMAAVMLVIYT